MNRTNYLEAYQREQEIKLLAEKRRLAMQREAEKKANRTLFRLKRYSNRKYYDMDEHCYCSLTQIGEVLLVRPDVTFVVTDHKTNIDYTKEVLAEMINKYVRLKDKERTAFFCHRLFELSLAYETKVYSDTHTQNEATL